MKNLKFGIIIILFLLAGKAGAQCTISLTSAPGTDNQSLCSGVAITTITYSTTEATGATFPGIPDGLSGNWTDNVVTITGTPTESGTFTVNLEGAGCGMIQATVEINIIPDNTIILSSLGNSNRTVCIENAINNIRFTTTGADGATFSGLPAGVNGSWSSNVATISGTPTEAGIFPYTVTTSGGCGSASAGGTITVNPSVAASVSIAASPGGPVCSGTSVTFTATPVNGGIASYQWRVDGSPVGMNSSTYTSSALTNGDVVTVTMTSNLACVTGSPAISNQIVMSVTPAVTPGVSIAALPPGTICAGTSVTFTATPLNGGLTPSYQWRVNSTNVGMNSPTFISSTLTNNDVVSVVMTSSSACNTGPATSNAITMSVTTPGAAGVSISAAPSGPVCEGTMVSFTAAPVNGGTPSYVWRLNGSVVGGNSSIYSSSALNDNDIITVTMTSSLGCVTGSPVLSNQIVMEVNPPVAASVSIAANPAGPICTGTPVTFTATPLNGGAPTYQWRVNGLPVGVNSAIFSSSTLDNNDAITVTMTSNAPCVTGSPATSNTITMSVTPAVPVSVTIAASPSLTICAGTSVTFTATPVNGGAIPSYQWKVNGANVGTDSPFFTSSTLSNNNIVTVVLTSSIACVSGNPATSNPLTMIVNALPVPTLISSEDITICAGTNVIFTASGGINYNFVVGGVSRQNGPSEIFTTNTLTNGQSVSVIVTNASNCSASTSGIQFFVNPAPFISIISATTCSADLSTYSFSVIVSSGIVTTTAGIATLTSTPNTWRISEVPSGTAVTVRVTSAGGCEDILEVSAPNCACPEVIAPVSGGDKSYCEGGTIPALSATVLSGETVDWYGESSGGGLLSSGLTFTPAAPGTYYALARNLTTNCVSSTRTAISLTANPAPLPTLISSDADDTFCPGTNVTFTAGGGSSYNFMVAGISVQNGALATFTTNLLTNGQTVMVTVTSSLGCTATSAGIQNTVQGSPVAVLTSSDPDNSFCSGTRVTFTATGGTSYNFRVGGLSVQNGAAAVFITTMLTNGQVVDVIVTNASGCTATSAGITNAVFLPPAAGAGTGGNNCGLNFHFNATLSAGTGTWTRVSGPGNATFTPDANSPMATASVSAYGNYVFRWTVVNGPCTVTSDIAITFIQQSAANAGPGGNECDLNYTFNALPITSGIGTWTKISGPGNTVFTPDNNQPGATVTVDQFGTYDFAWTVVNSTCSSSDIIRVGFHGAPEVNAGRDTAMCRGGSIQLQAVGSGTVLWTPSAHVSNPSIINPLITPDVTTTFTLSLTDQYGCQNSDEIIVGVRNNTTANAGPDQNIVYVVSSTLDAEPAAEFETGVWSLFSGTGVLSDASDAKTVVENLSPGENRFVWTVSNGFCPLSSDTVNIYVNDFVIPTLITPNMDGRNDYFVISGLFTFGKTELVIFDRRGAKVYSNPDYDNSWDGVNYNNNPLPDDTYFYSLKAANGISFKGYIVIKR